MINQTKQVFSEDVSKQLQPTAENYTIRTMQADLAGHPHIESNNQPAQEFFPTIKNETNIDSQSTSTQSPFEMNASAEKDNPYEDSGVSQKSNLDSIDIPLSKGKNIPNGKALYKLIITIVLMFIVLIIGAGSFYIYTSMKTSDQLATPKETDFQNKTPEQNIPNQEEVIITSDIEKYSSEKPNFLQVDTSSTTMSDLKTQLLKVLDEIKTLPPSKLYEFIIVDKNNNPVTFDSFSKIAKLNFSTIIAKKLDSDFSLFIYNDNGNPRLGLRVKTLTTDKISLLTELNKEEKTLPEDVIFLFSDVSIENRQKEFTTSKYDTNNEVVRYLNVNTEKTVSMDYTATENNLLIGTSKETLRKIYFKSKSTLN
jgi:hypothetical protein